MLGDHLTSWDRKPKGPNKSADCAWTLRVLVLANFRGIFFDRVGIIEGISTDLWLYLRVYLLSSVQVLLISWASSVFGIYLQVCLLSGLDSDILSIFGSSSVIFVVYERIYCTWDILSARFCELSSKR